MARGSMATWRAAVAVPLALPALLAAVVPLSCKYDPHPADGALRCSPDDECPDGYLCVSGACWSTAVSGPATVAGCHGNTASIAANAQVVRSCVLDLACNPFPASVAVSDCVTLNTQASTPGTRCTAGARTCADFQRCVGFGFAGTDLCAGHTGGRCVGSRAINCESTGASAFEDCAAAGGTCVVSGSGANAIADCRVVATCSETDGNTHCSGNVSYSCEAGVGFGSSCGAGSYCNTADGTCLLSGPECEATSDICNGQVDESCSDKNLYRYDCGSVGLGCQTSGGNTWCLAPGCTFADLGSCTESCSGSRLTFCYGGAPYTVDCRNFGFASCTAGLSSGGVSNYAKCTN